MSSTPQKFELKPLIYSYFDLVANEEPITNDNAWTTWQCKSQWFEQLNIPVDFTDLRLVFSSYLPCCAHAGQLVLKDGIKLDEEYTKLIKKVSKDIVSKTKVSNLIAEEVRKLEKTLLTYVITCWNSILFMIRSVLRLTDDDFKQIQKSMPKEKRKKNLI